MLAKKNYRNLSVFYRQNTVDERVLEHSFDKDIFYPALYDLKVGANPTIIDVGAHIGTFTLLSLIKFDQCKVISIEPNPDTFKILEKNIRSNNKGSVVLQQAALADTDGPIKLFLSSENWEHSITKDFGLDHITVPGLTLTEVFKQHNITSCDLLKMNCEGAEFRILLRTPPQILSQIKMMLILFHEDLVDPIFNRAGLRDFLIKNHFWVRETETRHDRGWMIARNQKFYNYQGPIREKLNRWTALLKANIFKNKFEV